VLEESGKQFVPWGFNYDHEGDGTSVQMDWKMRAFSETWTFTFGNRR
jgi:hypothetical protein